MDGDFLLERLDAFFSEGANTDAIGNFLSEEQGVMRLLGRSTDTQESLQLYALFKKYTAVVDALLHTFIAREMEAGCPIDLDQLAAAVMKEWRQEHDYCRYLCTAYVAGALDFESFKQLVADVNAMTTYPVGAELSDNDSVSEATPEEEDG
ncbi:hypothetical protein TraAM80_00935 [Trypanosoma rangeli]|uniref:BART domain-containing protein n=1 Tax=Trypanosoma rangeli TaxID=5698 RepID=A0A422P1B2_TRYRA|nr:uncharacterized protein TraAM80_00935 [Trypanosoma rangeli]RNF11489.1 hypothetical protein TraAM80_00935 [Trypanosoma rangeli]|eukprot:RNF11489.1 hypothetical protein TraAM80_00935 [Trypanosoma rangeli]